MGGLGVTTALSARTYISNVVEKFEQMFAPTPEAPFSFRISSTPMAESYHPKLDNSPLLTPKEASQFHALVGSANWIIMLGHLDICYAVQAMSRYNMAPPHIGHLEAMKRVFGYLKRFNKGWLVVNTSFPDHSIYNTSDYDSLAGFTQDCMLSLLSCPLVVHHQS